MSLEPEAVFSAERAIGVVTDSLRVTASGGPDGAAVKGRGP